MWQSIEPIYQAWLNKWRQLAAREQRLLQAMAVVLIIGLLYLLVWQPMESARKQAIQQKQNAQQQYQWLQQTLANWPQAAAANTQTLSKLNTQARLLGWLQQQVRQAGLGQSLSQLSPISANRDGLAGVRLRFDQVPATQLYQLLANIEKAGLTAEHIEWQRLDDQEQSKGLISGRIDYRVGR